MEWNEEVLEFGEVLDSDGDERPMVVQEIGHVPDLQEYYEKAIDRAPEVLQQWIHDLRDGSPLGDGWYEVDIPHYQAHGLPSRFLPRPHAALAKVTKEARTVSAGRRCKEQDFPISHFKSFSRNLAANGLLDEFPMIVKYGNHYPKWRARWGKSPLQALGYGAILHDDAWNPITWTLSAQVRTAAVKLLALPQYECLSKRFSD